MEEAPEIIRNVIDFQTPEKVCKYMASFLPENAGRILEPTPGAGNLLKQLVANHKNVVAPEDFFLLDIKTERFDWIVSNVPFSPMKLGYKILYDCRR